MKKHSQKFEVYGRKKGRKPITRLNSQIINKYLLNFDKDIISKKIILDIGSGNGENTIILSQKYPKNLIIASDIYKDGNINLCKILEHRNINNVKIFNQNVLILLEKIKSNELINEIWMLFPDPWPKNKHHKRRLINLSFLKKIAALLKKNKKIYVVTDSRTYFISILKEFYYSKFFKWVNDLPFMWDYTLNMGNKTKYYEKALINKRKSFIIIFERI